MPQKANVVASDIRKARIRRRRITGSANKSATVKRASACSWAFKVAPLRSRRQQGRAAPALERRHRARPRPQQGRAASGGGVHAAESLLGGRDAALGGAFDTGFC